MNGNNIKNINDSIDSNIFIDLYYDIKFHIYYFITGNKGFIKSFDYNKNKIYKKYDEGYYNELYLSIIIINNKFIIQLISSCTNGNILIWNFHSAELLNKIEIGNLILYNICLWNNEYIFVGSEKEIILVNINKGIIIKTLDTDNNLELNIKKIKHPIYGECLVSQGYNMNKNRNLIKLWVNIN